MNFLKRSIPPVATVLALYYLSMVIWWISINVRGLVDTAQNFYFGVGLGIFAILSGFGGLRVSKDWGWFSSRIGKMIILLSLGFMAWGIGTLMIGYYNLALGQAYPYPSLADLAYILSWPLWIAGMINLSKATGARYQLKNIRGKAFALLTIVFGCIISYYLLFYVARGGVFVIDQESYLRLFFDFAYPVGDLVILTSALLLFGLSFNYLGGKLKLPIFMIIAGFVMNYIADVSFTYTNTIETFYVAGWVDLVYLTTFALLGIGVNLFDQRVLKENQKKDTSIVGLKGLRSS